MKLHLSLMILLSIHLLPGVVFAEQSEESTPASTADRLVEVEYYQDNLAEYKARREDHGFYFGLTFEPIEFKKYISTIDNKIYGDVFGSSTIPLILMSMEYKYNFAMGGISLGVGLGKGSLSSSFSGEDRSIDMTKYGLGVKYTMDNFGNEPLVAPYVGINVWYMGISETSPTKDFSATTEMGFNYVLGLLIQLNWMDGSTSQETNYAWGLENTFLDLYASKYEKTAAVDGANTETDMQFGAGLRLEF